MRYAWVVVGGRLPRSGMVPGDSTVVKWPPRESFSRPQAAETIPFALLGNAWRKEDLGIRIRNLGRIANGLCSISGTKSWPIDFGLSGMFDWPLDKTL